MEWKHLERCFLSAGHKSPTFLLEKHIIKIKSICACRDLGDSEATGGGGQKKRQKVYPEHLSFSAVQAGIKSGKYHQGSLRVSQYNSTEGWVSLFEEGKVWFHGSPHCLCTLLDGRSITTRGLAARELVQLYRLRVGVPV